MTIDRGDIDLLEIRYKDYHFNGSLPFGLGYGSVLFMHCSDVICFIMKRHGFENFCNYIDELIFVCLLEDIYKSFEFLQHLIQVLDLGLEISQSKLIPPATAAICLGILLDITDTTISIPYEELSRIKEMWKSWCSKMYCSKQDLQTLLVSLLSLQNVSDLPVIF